VDLVHHKNVFKRDGIRERDADDASDQSRRSGRLIWIIPKKMANDDVRIEKRAAHRSFAMALATSRATPSSKQAPLLRRSQRRTLRVIRKYPRRTIDHMALAFHHHPAVHGIDDEVVAVPETELFPGSGRNREGPAG